MGIGALWSLEFIPLLYFLQHIVEGGGIESVDESIIETIIETTMFNHLSVIFVGIGWV